MKGTKVFSTHCEVIDVFFKEKTKAEIMELIASELDKGLPLHRFSGRFYGIKKDEPIEVSDEAVPEPPDVSD